jgi:hypothetical protein
VRPAGGLRVASAKTRGCVATVALRIAVTQVAQQLAAAIVPAVRSLRAALKFRVARRYADAILAVVRQTICFDVTGGVEAEALRSCPWGEAIVAVQVADAAVAVAVFVAERHANTDIDAARGAATASYDTV